MGNGGMVQACKANPGCIAYIGVSYLSQATAAGLGYAALKNKSGNYELPTQAADQLPRRRASPPRLRRAGRSR